MRALYTTTIMFRSSFLMMLSVFVVCQFCEKDFVSIGRHSWRCKQRIHQDQGNDGVMNESSVHQAPVINSPKVIIPTRSSELYIYGRLTSVNYVIKKCNTKWRKLKAFLGVIFSPLTCAVKYFCKFLFGFLWRKVFRNGFFPF